MVPNKLEVKNGSTWGSVKEKITATADDGYAFKEWQKDGKTLNDSFVINKNSTIKAIFELKPKINWSETPLSDLDHGFNNQTLYDASKTATSIQFTRDSSTNGTLCGQSEGNNIYASFNTETSLLKVWSESTVIFTDENRPNQQNSSVGLFYDCQKLETINLENADFSRMTNMSGMFCNCLALTSLDLSSFDTSNVTNMSAMFSNCKKLATLNISSFDTSNVTNMNSMFYYCNELRQLDLSKFKTSTKVSKMCDKIA